MSVIARNEDKFANISGIGKKISTEASPRYARLVRFCTRLLRSGILSFENLLEYTL